MQKSGPASWYYKHNMDAVTYLISRKSKSAYRLSGLFLIASIIIWANHNALAWAKLQFAETLGSGIPLMAYSAVNFLTYLACFAVIGGVLLALPCQQMFALTGTLRNWSENRILDEFTSTGLSYRYLLNHLLKYYMTRWLILSIPTFLFLGVAAAGFDVRVPHVALLYYTTMSVLFLSVTCSACWNIALEKHSSAFVLVPFLVLVGPLFLLFALFGANFWLLALVSTLYVGLMSYVLSLQALEKQAILEEVTLKVRSRLDFKQGRKASSENPIVARQEMRGDRFETGAIVLGSLALLTSSLYHSHQTSEFQQTFAVLVLVGLIAAWRAAAKLSQSLTGEMESSTLETIRSTPMGSEIFLQGWLQVTLRPLMAEMAVMVALILPLLVLKNPQALYDGSFLFIVIIAMSAPLLGALFGASIAGQCRPRNEVSGQISTTVILFSVLGLPQIFITLASYNNHWFSVLFTLLLVYGACWALKAGARKSLNRVFLPQK